MNRLRELRKKFGFTQEELGRLLGVQKAAVCKYENGRCSIPQEILLKLCDILSVSADYLLCRSDEEFSLSLLKGGASLDIPVVNTTSVPVVGRVHAGLPILQYCIDGRKNNSHILSFFQFSRQIAGYILQPLQLHKYLVPTRSLLATHASEDHANSWLG